MTKGDDLADWDAAYVLGALSSEERLAYEDYLAADPARAASLNELAGLPGILNALSPVEALALLDAPSDDDRGAAGPPDLMPSLARAAQRRQQRTRRTVMALVAATAAAFLAIGGIVSSTVFKAPAPSSSTAAPRLEAMRPTDVGGLTAQLAVTQKPWGTRFDWQCQYTNAWSKGVASYDLVVTTDDGRQTTVASWGPGGTAQLEEATGLAAATTIPTSRIQTVDIRVAGATAPLAVTTLR
ncbi:MAG: hypothetical protein JO191_13990 [Mycobacteriaceae bacterium]|nr:hypothetical protein [Mycobacteriaceae bacterium]